LAGWLRVRLRGRMLDGVLVDKTKRLVLDR
jgi:hypothetical protein